MPAVPPSSFILAIQSDLSGALGIPVPLTGVIGAATRRAIRLFQSRMGLMPTGQLTGSTLRALRRAVSLPAMPVVEEPVSEPFADPVEEPAEEPVESAASEGDADEPQEEYRITKPGSLALTRWGTLDLGAHTGKKPKQIGALLPTGSGIYVIHTASGAWYAGQAGNIRERFSSRFSALKDFGLSSAVLDGRSITCYLLPAALPDIAVFIKPNGLQRGYRADNRKGILTALEDHFINKLGTLGKGNEKLEGATASASASLSIAGSGAAPAWESTLAGKLVLPPR